MTAKSTSVSVLTLAWCLAGLATLPDPRGAQAQPARSASITTTATAASSAVQIEFDIAAQRLGDAIDVYSRLTGLDVLLDGEQAQRPANAVLGTFTALQALETMLAGTGLEARYATASSVVIRAARASGTAAATPGGDASAYEESGFQGGEVLHQSYAAQVQQALRASLCDAAETRPGGYRLALQLRLDGHGMAERFRLLSTTGKTSRDAAVLRKVRTLSVGSPPPPSLPQPLVILLLPEGPDTEPACPPLGAIGRAP
ncbi:STN domain-containing protein [Variovorax paradoxus]|uniref:STN domain-containing protein n=1 Tax=Variovorax paradoxus TaxID=34073 RepID=UPI0021AC000F|nr:STN domain-containing protein [Variovorax paradoxus]UVH57831.1 STN domain-containing protein [Variovorax paradoxus]